MSLPPDVVTTRPDGTEDHWTYSHSVADRGLTSDERHDEQTSLGESKQWTGCEWVTTSGYRRGTCGRGAMRNRFGLSLCWQHEDAVFSHVLGHLRNGRYYAKQTEELAAAILTIGGLEKRDALGGTPVRRLVRAELRRLLQDLIDGQAPDCGVGDLLDELVSQRIQRVWGTV